MASTHPRNLALFQWKTTVPKPFTPASAPFAHPCFQNQSWPHLTQFELSYFRYTCPPFVVHLHDFPLDPRPTGSDCREIHFAGNARRLMLYSRNSVVATFKLSRGTRIVIDGCALASISYHVVGYRAQALDTAYLDVMAYDTSGGAIEYFSEAWAPFTLQCPKDFVNTEWLPKFVLSNNAMVCHLNLLSMCIVLSSFTSSSCIAVQIRYTSIVSLDA